MAILMPDLTVDVYNADYRALSRIRWQEAVADPAGCGVCHRRAPTRCAIRSVVTGYALAGQVVAGRVVAGQRFCHRSGGGHLDAFFLGM